MMMAAVKDSLPCSSLDGRLPGSSGRGKWIAFLRTFQIKGGFTKLFQLVSVCPELTSNRASRFDLLKIRCSADENRTWLSQEFYNFNNLTIFYSFNLCFWRWANLNIKLFSFPIFMGCMGFGKELWKELEINLASRRIIGRMPWYKLNLKRALIGT